MEDEEPQVARIAPGAPRLPNRATAFADQVIPAKNPLALTGYYVGIFSLIPCVGALLGPAAIVLGAKGLKAIQHTPGLPGKAHSLIAVVIGGLTSLGNWALILLTIIGLVMGQQRQ